MFKRRDKNSSLETKIIGVAGAGEKSGCTHACIILANRIRAAGCSVAILEENKSGCFRKIAEEFECETDNEGRFVYCSVDYFTYRKPRLLPIILRQGYDFLIVDHGSFNECDRDFYLTNHMHVIICGSRPWEMDGVQDIFETVQTEEMLEAFHYCFNFAHDNLHLQRNIRKAMGTLANVYFPPYSEDVFHNSEFGDLDEAVGISVADNVPRTEGIRMLGVFGKKKEEKKTPPPAGKPAPVLLEEKIPDTTAAPEKENGTYDEVPDAEFTEVEKTPEPDFVKEKEGTDAGNMTVTDVTENAAASVITNPVPTVFREEKTEEPPENGPEIIVQHVYEESAENKRPSEDRTESADSGPVNEMPDGGHTETAHTADGRFSTECSEAEQPVPETPVTVRTVMKQPEIKTSVTEQPAAKPSAAVQSVTEQPVTERIITKPAATETSAAEQPVAEQTEMSESYEINVCFESYEQAMQLFNILKELNKYARYRLKDSKNTKGIEALLNKCLKMAFISALRGGVEHSREPGADGSYRVIRIQNDVMTYEIRENDLTELLGDEFYLIDPYEDNYSEF